MSDFHFEYDANHGVLAVLVTGAFTDDAMRALYETMASRLGQREVRAAFLDLSAVGEFNVSAEAVRSLSKRAPLFPDPLPKYIVATHDAMFGMARMYQITSQGRETLRIVRSRQDVYTSLGLDAPCFERLDIR